MAVLPQAHRQRATHQSEKDFRLSNSPPICGKCRLSEKNSAIRVTISGPPPYMDNRLTSPDRRSPVKVVLETTLMDEEEIAEACRIACDAGAHFVKAGTGFYGDTTVADVEAIGHSVESRALIAAGGGYREANQVAALLSAGAQRVTTPFLNDLLSDL